MPTTTQNINVETEERPSKIDLGNHRPSYSIKTPCLTRNALFKIKSASNPRWSANPKYPSDGETCEDRWSIICPAIESHINKIQNIFDPRIKYKIVSPYEQEVIHENIFSLKQTILITICDRGGCFPFRFRIRIDLYHELCGFSYIVDDVDVCSDLDISNAFSEIFNNPINIEDNCETLFGEFWGQKSFASILKRRVGVVNNLEYLQYEKNCGEIDDHFSKNGDINSIWFNIADFSGIIVHTADFSRFMKYDESLGIPEAFDVPSRGGIPDDRIYDFEFKSTRRELTDKMKQFVDSNIVLINHISGQHEITNIDKPDEGKIGGESVVCGVLGGTALYAAELGHWGTSTRDVQPVRHLVVYDGKSEKQLGRLVRRLHILGELRHAALLDYDIISKESASDTGRVSVSQEIHLIGKDLNKSSDMIMTKAGLPIGDLKSLVVRLNKVNSMSDGGLLYRIERSRYYAKSYTDLLPHLKCVLIEPWQPYDEFAKRYLIQLFDRIDLIGRRYENMGRRLDRLLFFKQADAGTSYQDAVQGMIQEVIKSTTLLNGTSKKQSDLLSKADKFTVIILFYYGMSVVEKFLRGLEFDKYGSYIGEFFISNINIFHALWIFAMGYLLRSTLKELYKKITSVFVK